MGKIMHSKKSSKCIYLKLVIFITILLIGYLIVNWYIDKEHTYFYTSKVDDIFYEYYDEAYEMLKRMTLDEKVGQLFLVRFENENVISEIKEQNPGGYILFGRDFKNETKETIIAKLQEYQKLSKIRLLLAVDEEGGTVTRVSRYKEFRDSNFLSPQDLYKIGGLNEIVKDSSEKSSLLKSLGLNMNLAPVADIPTNKDSFIYKRSYGMGAKETANYIGTVIRTMNTDGMISVIKHFPGYGDNVDTHTGVAIDNRSIEYFRENDLLPFIVGIEAKAPCIMMNHNIIAAIDDTKPASLSKPVYDMLRNELKFTGIIMTDDLEMDAVKSYVENGEAAVYALLAGADIIISSDFEKQKNEILQALEDGIIQEDIIDYAVLKVLALKCMYNII